MAELPDLQPKRAPTPMPSWKRAAGYALVTLTAGAAAAALGLAWRAGRDPASTASPSAPAFATAPKADPPAPRASPRVQGGLPREASSVLDETGEPMKSAEPLAAPKTARAETAGEFVGGLASMPGSAPSGPPPPEDRAPPPEAAAAPGPRRELAAKGFGATGTQAGGGGAALALSGRTAGAQAGAPESAQASTAAARRSASEAEEDDEPDPRSPTRAVGVPIVIAQASRATPGPAGAGGSSAQDAAPAAVGAGSGASPSGGAGAPAASAPPAPGATREAAGGSARGGGGGAAPGAAGPETSAAAAVEGAATAGAPAVALGTRVDRIAQEAALPALRQLLRMSDAFYGGSQTSETSMSGVQAAFANDRAYFRAYGDQPIVASLADLEKGFFDSRDGVATNAREGSGRLRSSIFCLDALVREGNAVPKELEPAVKCLRDSMAGLGDYPVRALQLNASTRAIEKWQADMLARVRPRCPAKPDDELSAAERGHCAAARRVQSSAAAYSAALRNSLNGLRPPWDAVDAAAAARLPGAIEARHRDLAEQQQRYERARLPPGERTVEGRRRLADAVNHLNYGLAGWTKANQATLEKSKKIDEAAGGTIELLRSLANLRQAAGLLPATLPPEDGQAGNQGPPAPQPQPQPQPQPRPQPRRCAEPPSADFTMVGCNRVDHLPCPPGQMAWVRTGDCIGINYRCVPDAQCQAPACRWQARGCGGQGNAFRQQDYVREILVFNQTCRNRTFDMGLYDSSCGGGCQGSCLRRGQGFKRGLCQANGTGMDVGYCRQGGRCFCYR